MLTREEIALGRLGTFAILHLQEVLAMSNDVFQIMHSVFFPQPVSEGSGAWRPPVDVYRTRDGWLLKFDLAGVRPEDIVVEVHERQIEVSGMRRDWCLEEGCCHYRMEISYSRFERVVELPDEMEGARVATEFRHGMLLIRINPEIVR
jgi:HSP20 family protein